MIRTVGILLVLAAALACSAPRKESRGTEAPSLGSKPAVVKPWTDAGDQGAVSTALLARTRDALASAGVEHAVAVVGT